MTNPSNRTDVTDAMIEAVARAIAEGCNLDPDAVSPRTNKAGHTIPEWMFFGSAATKAIAAMLTAQPQSGEVELPATLAGHWATEGGQRIAQEYLAKSRSELAHGDMSDLELANAVFMADRLDLALIGFQTAAKQRIRWLSAQLAALRSAQPVDQEEVDTESAMEEVMIIIEGSLARHGVPLDRIEGTRDDAADILEKLGAKQ